MISKLSNSISEKLCYANVIPTEDQELYSYGFFLLLSRGFFFVVSVIFGALFQTIWESVIFYGLFSLLRGYSGGVHASAESVCMFFTTVLLLLASAFLHLMETSGCVTIAVVMLSVGGTAVFLLSPLDSEEKPLNSSERQYYRRISRFITAVTELIAFGAMAIGCYSVLYIVGICFFSESVLLLIGKVKTLYLAR